MKNKKYYHSSRKRIIVDKAHIEDYLAEVRQKIKIGLCRFALNKNRQDNIDLLVDYVITKSEVKEIISTLNYIDFSEILQNDHKGYEHEFLYVFGKTVVLKRKKSQEFVDVHLYIKTNNVKDSSVIIISFHEQKHPLKLYFKRK